MLVKKNGVLGVTKATRNVTAVVAIPRVARINNIKKKKHYSCFSPFFLFSTSILNDLNFSSLLIHLLKYYIDAPYFKCRKYFIPVGTQSDRPVSRTKSHRVKTRVRSIREKDFSFSWNDRFHEVATACIRGLVRTSFGTFTLKAQHRVLRQFLFFFSF